MFLLHPFVKLNIGGNLRDRGSVLDLKTARVRILCLDNSHLIHLVNHLLAQFSL